MGVSHVTPEPSFSGLVLNHQGLEELDLKKTPKNCCFWLNLSLFERFFGSGFFKSWWSSTKPLYLGSGVIYWPPGTYGYPGTVGVDFSNDLRQLRVGIVTVKERGRKFLKGHFYISLQPRGLLSRMLLKLLESCLGIALKRNNCKVWW